MRINLRHTLLAALLSSIPIGMSAQTEWAGTLTDSAGIPIISNPSEGLWTKGSQWTVVEELRIGSIEGDPEYQFGQIGWIATSSDDQVLVLDMQAQEMRAFDADGQYQRTIGQPGQGPGELNGAMFVFSGPDDIITVPDVFNQRINRFSVDGTPLTSFPLFLGDGLPIVFQSTSAGTIVEQVRVTNRGLDAIIVLPFDTTTPDTLVTFPSGRSIQPTDGIPVINVYSPEPTWAVRDNLNVVYGINDTYRFTEIGRDGSIRRIVSLPAEQHRVSDSDRRAVMTFLEQAWLDAGVPPSALPEFRANVTFGEFLPVFAAMQLGPEETVWIQHFQPASSLTEDELEHFNLLEDTGAPEWDVFDVEGRFLGVVAMPDRFAPRLFAGNEIYGVWRDELEVQYVMRLRINMP